MAKSQNVNSDSFALSAWHYSLGEYLMEGRHECVTKFSLNIQGGALRSSSSTLHTKMQLNDKMQHGTSWWCKRICYMHVVLRQNDVSNPKFDLENCAWAEFGWSRWESMVFLLDSPALFWFSCEGTIGLHFTNIYPKCLHQRHFDPIHIRDLRRFLTLSTPWSSSISAAITFSWDLESTWCNNVKASVLRSVEPYRPLKSAICT